MSISQQQASESVRPESARAPQEIWFTRCPVPTATGLAYNLGWLGEEFTGEGIAVQTLQDNRQLGRHHYDHRIDTLVREGGSILALAARAQGAPSRLIGLTWIDEWQAILVRPDSGIAATADLKGKRLALPQWTPNDISDHARGSSISRGMSLQGYRGALRHAGLGFEDVRLVEVPANRPVQVESTRAGLDRLWSGIDYLVEGKVDAVYVKGASAVDAAQAAGVVVGIDLDALPGQAFRINNGTRVRSPYTRISSSITSIIWAFPRSETACGRLGAREPAGRAGYSCRRNPRQRAGGQCGVPQRFPSFPASFPVRRATRAVRGAEEVSLVVRLPGARFRLLAMGRSASSRGCPGTAGTAPAAGSLSKISP